MRVRPGAAGDSRQRRRRTVSWLLLGGAGILVVISIVGEKGYLATIQVRRTEVALTHELTRLRLDNRDLQVERKRLESDPAALEEAIRAELGYIRPGETAIVVKDVAPVPEQPPR